MSFRGTKIQGPNIKTQGTLRGFMNSKNILGSQVSISNHSGSRQRGIVNQQKDYYRQDLCFSRAQRPKDSKYALN